jgi:signal peptidase I
MSHAAPKASIRKTGAGKPRRATGSPNRRDHRRPPSLAREVVVVVVVALALSVFVRVFLFQAFFVPSQSMENTLLVNDRILTSKISTKLGGVSRGEVIVFSDPGGWLPAGLDSGGPTGWVKNVLTFVGLLPSDSGQDLVKRVIGVAGDHVLCCDDQGRIVLNSVSLDEPYIKPGGGTAQQKFDVIVPPGTVFVMGDNRGDSSDSRFHLAINQGGVPLGNIVGRAVFRIYPIDRWGVIDIPVTFSNPALNKAPTR